MQSPVVAESLPAEQKVAERRTASIVGTGIFDDLITFAIGRKSVDLRLYLAQALCLLRNRGILQTQPRCWDGSGRGDADDGQRNASTRKFEKPHRRWDEERYLEGPAICSRQR